MRLEYILYILTSSHAKFTFFCGIFVSPELSPLKTNMSSHWNRICVSWVIETNEPTGPWRVLTYFPAMGKMEHQGFRQLNTSPKKNFGFRHIPHSQSQEYCSFSLSNIQKLYGVLWVTDPSFPLFPFLFLHVYSHFHFNGSPLASQKFKDSAFHRSRIVEIEGHKKRDMLWGKRVLLKYPLSLSG